MTRWIALRFPWLPIERLQSEFPSKGPSPLVLYALDASRETVVAVSEPAWRTGIRVGMSVTAARALCSKLQILPHDVAADRRLWVRFANLCQRVTPDIVLSAPHVLLLEVGRTAERFGGEAALVERLIRGFQRLGHRARVGVASTPAAARALAKAGGEQPRLAPEGQLLEVLSPLPHSVLDLPTPILKICAGLGLRSVGDVVSLPRADIATRFGERALNEIDRLLGRSEEPLRRFVPEMTFHERVDFSAPTESISSILFAAKRLMDLAEAELLGRMSAVESLMVSLEPAAKGPPWSFELRPGEPTCSCRRWLSLLQHRLEKRALSAPVDAVSVSFQHTVPIRMDEGSLFDDPRAGVFAEQASRLRDRLASRMGEERVLGVELTEDHRPERAFVLTPKTMNPRCSVARPTHSPRPMIIEGRPERLVVRSDDSGRPICIEQGRDRGPIRWARGPERIEAGWWDGGDIRRSYFEIETSIGARWWVYRDLSSGDWHRHGLFS